MAKTYKINYSVKEYFRSSSASSNTTYRQSNPEQYLAGATTRYRCAVKCEFSGLSSINASRVTGITVSVQRVTGGSNITYGVALYGSVLSEAVEATLRVGYPVFVTNREVCDWTGSSSDTSGVYRTYTIDKSLFTQLKNYGWALAYRNQTRTINVGNVYLTVTTNETDYTLTYNANGGSGAPGKQTGTGVGSYTFTISSTKPTRTGYTFLGWSLSSTATSASYQPGGKIKLTASDTLYAVWKANTYTVSYNANGGSGAPASQTKTYGKALTLSTTKPTRTGHTFLRWNTKADGSGTSYAPGGSYTANASVTLYAQWQINTYTVSYNANGGSGAPASQTKTYGKALTLSTTKPTRTGHTFLRWNTKADGSGTSYAPGGSYTANASVTLYAQWQINTYTVSYDANCDDIVVMPVSQTKTYGVTLTLDDYKPTRIGYDFIEYNTNAAGTGTSYAPGGSYTANASVTLYAQWKALTYTISYNASGGSGAPSSQTKTYGVDIALSSVQPTKTGHTFLYWNTSASGSGSTYNPGDTYTANANLTLYAIWELNSYTITFDANGGEGAPENQIKYYGVDLTISSSVPTKEGFKFTSWNTLIDGTGISFSPGGTFTLNANTTLYAQWMQFSKYKKIYYEDSSGNLKEALIYYKMNDGSMKMSVAYYKDENGIRS